MKRKKDHPAKLARDKHRDSCLRCSTGPFCKKGKTLQAAWLKAYEKLFPEDSFDNFCLEPN